MHRRDPKFEFSVQRPDYWLLLGYAFGASILICLGSFFGIVAPGDGQTGMFLYPLWGIGGVLGVYAIVGVFKAHSSSVVRLIVIILACIALTSVIWSFVASAQYSRGWEQRHREKVTGV